MNDEKKSKKKKIIAIAVVVVLILVVILIKVFGTNKEVEPEYETAAVEQKTLTTTISSTGKVAAQNSKNVTAQLVNYKVTKVNVKVGDVVKEGDILCTFDTADLAKTISDLEATINASGVAGNAGVVASDIQVKQAEEALNNQLGPIHDQVKEAESLCSQLDLTLKDLRAQLDAKQKALATADDATKAALNAEIGALQTAIAQTDGQYQAARNAHSAAVQAYGKAASSLNDALTIAKSQADSTKAQTGISSLTTEQQLVSLKKQLADTNLKAPVSGTVTSVAVKAGDYYVGGSVLTIEGVETLVVQTEIDEYDIADIKLGMEAELKTDSTRDEILHGKVTSIAPAATGSVSAASSASSMSMMGMTGSTGSSGATYTVEITLDAPNDRLRIGMNAKLNIITQKSENALIVPYDAVNEKEDGSKTVTIIKDNEEEEEITVTTGLESGYYTEISSDKIKEGMNVKIPKVGNTTSVDELLSNMGATGGM